MKAETAAPMRRVLATNPPSAVATRPRSGAVSVSSLTPGFGSLRPAESIGTSVSATSSESSNEKVTVSAWSRNSWPAMPEMNTIGKNTATEVRVAAVTAIATSDVPWRAASAAGMPCSRRRTMASSTTTALSTSMPTAKAMPPSDMMLSDTFAQYMSMKVPMTDTGMAMLVTKVARASRRKK